MVTKLQRTEQGVMIVLPEDILETLGLSADTEVSITTKPSLGQIIITPASEILTGVDEEFARQVSDFIDQYRPALEALAK
jgi:hypothetical protein